ncbi:MAG: FG-GAP-like repeat-containing protein [Rhodobiaceae bacterium]|nr:FG-GAP-like repeat-containing protein [Rhodobiaceae bacterium]
MHQILRVLSKSLLVSAALSLAVIPAHAADPNGSRYDNWAQNEVWLPHYGLHTDQGWPSSKYPRMFGDVNGDGMDDVVAFGEHGVYVGVSTGTSFRDDTNVWSKGYSYAEGWRVGSNPRFVIDMNNDGKADLVGFALNGVDVSLSTGTAFEEGVKWTDQFGTSTWGDSNFIRTLADVNGDKYPDVVGFGDDGVYVSLNEPHANKFGSKTRWISNYGTDHWWNTTDFVRELADVNGDGMADIVGFGIQGTYVSLAQTNNTFNAAALVLADFGQDQGWSNTENVRTVADVNGDGQADLVGFGDSNTYVGFSNGDNATNSWKIHVVTHGFGLNSGWTVDDTLRLMADVNADGKADIVGFNGPGMQVAVSKGQGTSITYSEAAQWVNDFGTDQSWSNAETPRYMVDVNGDGRPEPAGYGYAGVYVSPSASLYCCDKVNFLDTGSSPANQQVDGAWIGRAYLPRTELVLNDLNNPTTCVTDKTHKNPVEPIVANPTGYLPWSTQYTARLFMNANFYDIKAGNPSVTPCTTALGWTISNTKTISKFAQVHGRDTQTMVFSTPAVARATGIYAKLLRDETVREMRDTIQNAVSGFILVKDGVLNDESAGISAASNRARAALGITEDGKTLITVVVNNGGNGGPYPNGGTTLKGLAHLLISLGAYDALTLDGSGSSQLIFDNGTVTYKSVGSDTVQGHDHQYRPVPVFLGIQ